MSSLFPGGIDSFTHPTTGDVVDPALPNDQSDSIVAVQSTLGTNPQLGFSTVAELLAATALVSNIQAGALLYGADTGSINALAVALSPTPPSYTAGQVIYFTVANTNSGACTIAVNGQTAVSLVKNGTSPLAAGDIQAGQTLGAVYDGTNFQIVVPGSSGGSTPVCANTVNEFRMTLVSGTPIVADDTVAAGTTMYFTPYTGDRIGLYDSGPGWQVFTSAELSIDISMLGDGVYDLFVYDDSGSPALEIGPQWTDSNDRSTDLVIQDGVYVENGDPTRRYAGTFAILGGAAFDNYSARGVYNAQNRIPRVLTGYGDTFSTSSSGWTAVIQAYFVLGLVEESLTAWASAYGAGDASTAAAEVGIGLASDPGPDYLMPINATIGTSTLSASFVRLPSQVGYDGLTLFFRTSVDTVTVNLLDDGHGQALTYLVGMVWM